MKKEYMTPAVEVVTFETEDVITTSTPIADLNAPELPLIMFE